LFAVRNSKKAGFRFIFVEIADFLGILFMFL